MIYFRGTKDIHLDHTVVALGKFDGLHRGHQLLINKLKEYGKFKRKILQISNPS